MKLTTPSKTRKVLAQGQIITANSSTTIYTVPTGQVAEIKSFTLTNSSASGAVLDGGWFIQVTASIGTAINYCITGEVG
jgi:hypothetical protein